MLRAGDLHILQQAVAFLHTPIVILDTEATGGNFFQDRLTEVALVRLDESGIHTYQQLINPERPISRFIEKLTGISSDMVADAPTFAQQADALLPFLQGAILLAHNSRFDYHFLRVAFKRAGKNLSMPCLCTVKLSRLLYPEHFKHNLDSIIERFNICLPQRHRAMADVAALSRFLAHACRERADVWQASIKKLIQPALMPSWLTHSLQQQIAALPDEYGVVLVHDAGAAAPKVRVFEHMYHDVCRALHSAHAEDRFASIARIEGIAATGPIDAAMTAAHYADNDDDDTFYTVRFVADERQTMQVRIQPLTRQADSLPPFGVFAHPKAAKKAVTEWARKHGFCPKQLNILPQSLPAGSPCPLKQSRTCHGMCQRHGQNADAAHLYRLAAELPIAGWQSKWSGEVAETDPVTGATKRWQVSRSAVLQDDGLWLWNPDVFQALKNGFRQAK